MEAYSQVPPSETVDISTERMMGLVGSVIGLLGAIPYLGSILSLLGLVLILIALHGIGNKLGDERPFKNYLKGFIIALVGVIIGLILVFSAFAMYTHTTNEVVYHDNGLVLYERDLGMEDSELTTTGYLVVFAGIAVVIVALVFGVYFEKKAWEAMYEITGVEEFKKTAKFLWWGALTLIILVGAILLLVSAIYQILAFSNLPQRISKRVPQPEVPVEDFTW